MDLSGFLRYWSLTLAVFVFYVFAIIVASLDIAGEVRQAISKKRASLRGPALDPNPLTGRTVAATMLSGPGQQPDAKREWVARMATDIAKRLNARVHTLVLEDSKGHPLVHFNDGKRVETYRIDRTLVEAAMAGETSKVTEVSDLLTRHLIADFLGLEETRPQRMTELAREASSKPAAAARPAAQAPAAAARPAATVRPEPIKPAEAPEPTGEPAESPKGQETPAAPPAATAPPPGTGMSREERLAAARAKAEELKARARQQQEKKDT